MRMYTCKFHMPMIGYWVGCGNHTFCLLYMQVFTRTGRRTHINVPQNCWSDMGTTFQELVNEMPPPSDQEEGSGGSGSED